MKPHPTSPTKTAIPSQRESFSLRKVLSFGTASSKPPVAQPMGDVDELSNNNEIVEALRQQNEDLRKTLSINKKLITELMNSGELPKIREVV